MKTSFTPVRLAFEIALVIGLAEVLVVASVSTLTTGLSSAVSGLVHALLLALCAGPAVYWRCAAALRRPTSASTETLVSAKTFNLGAAIALTAAAQLIGLAATASAVLWLKHDMEKDTQALFDHGVERIDAEVRRRFNQPLLGLKGVRATYAASRSLARRDFQAQVEALDLPTEFPGIRGFGFVARVARADLVAYTAAQRADHAPEFEVQTDGQAADLFVVQFVEPIANNRAAFGYDLGQDPARREPAERAMNTGRPALSGKVTLLQDGTRSPGWLYFLPVYRPGTEPVTPQQHRVALVGLLYAPLVASELLRDVAAIADNGLRVELFDGDDPGAEHRMFGPQGQ